ncbi:MAG: M15 family metallopeptidase [Hornefia butyriciproducens]|nr:M15 family metallopeptidase [Hornefia butyriciproducens]
MSNYTETPIPVLPDLEQYTKTAFIDSPLTEVKESEKIDIRMQYPVLGFKNGEQRCFLRREVHEMLQNAAAKLPEGYRFRIWDTWRPFALQEELFVSYSAKIIKEFHLEDMSEEEQHSFIGKFVANPIPDRTLPPAHTTGGAVDLTLVGPDGEELEMGCGFDAFTDKTRAAFFETEEAAGLPDAELIRDNRRLLYHLMLEAGFTNLPSEWWHFEYGDKNWSAVVDKPALYDGIFELD